MNIAQGWRKRKITMFKFGCNACGETWEIATPRTCKCEQIFKREWFSLTDEESKELWYSAKNIMGWYSFQEIAKLVEAKLKEKNTNA